MDLVLNSRVALDTLFAFEIVKEFINVTGTLFQDVLGSVKNGDFSFDFIKSFLHRFELVVLDTEVGSVLTEVVALHVLLALLLLVEFLFVSECFLESHLLGFQLFVFFHLLVLLFGNAVGLRLVNCEVVIGRGVLLQFQL